MVVPAESTAWSRLVATWTACLQSYPEDHRTIHSVPETEQLHIRGSIAGYAGVVLERDLTDNSVTPAEFFEYGPDLLFTFPRDLTSRKYKWKEIAP